MSVQRIGRYEIVSTLGRGAMGVVYLARDPLIDRQVALKTLRVDLDAEYAGEFRERFLREAKAAGRLNHPGIVTIHDVGEDPETGLVFIAMEYIEGRDLKQMLADGHRFRPSEAARIIADVAQALDYAHSMGVVHRDIKPANIILTRDGSSKITDFGIAHLESSNLTVDGQFIGTPNFMSPEQITGRPVDGRSDIFSLGVVLYTLLTGKRPFAGETMHEVTLKVVGEPCPVPSATAPHVPTGFNPIILKCLEKDPAKRFQRGSELATVLAALGRSLTGRAPGDAASTGVVQPDLATRVHPSAAAATSSVPLDEQPPRRSMLRDFTSPRRPGQRPWRDMVLDRLPMPRLLKLEVNPLWVLIIIASWAVLSLAPAGVLALRRPTGPFIAPSDATIRNRHLAAHQFADARRLLAGGELRAAAAACSRGLDQVPASPAGRRLMADIRAALDAARTSEENRARVAELVAEGRELYRDGAFRDAEGLFRRALDLDPEDELAASFLDLARERLRSAALERRPSSGARTRVASTTQPRTAGPGPPTPQPTPGTARVTVRFDSPISVGNITITRNDAVLADIPFDHSTKGLLGIRRKGTGQVRRLLQTPSGRQTIGIQLRDAERGLIGVGRFERDLAPGTDWTLRIDMPEVTAEPNFFLVQTSR